MLIDVDDILYRDYTCICGVDEAGRGPLAGPVCAAAVVLPRGLDIDGLNDSKKLSEKKREFLYGIIVSEAVTYNVAFASLDEIEELNIRNAALLAMERAIMGLHIRAGYALVDGDTVKGITLPATAVVKGDGIYRCIAAASVLAKVSRDRLMCEYDQEYPEYGFGKHKGYGTFLHVEMLRKYGPSPIHRPSFLKKILRGTL